MPSSKQFVLTNGTKFIRQNLDGKYEVVSNQSLADIYESSQVARNILLNSISKATSSNYYVAEIKNNKLVQTCATRVPKTVRKCSNNVVVAKQCEGEEKWYDKLLGIGELFEHAMKRNYEISQELSDVDSMIVDLEHYIEFSELNARDGYVAYKKLHNLLLRRRKIKNEQKVVNVITKNYGIADDIKQIEEIIRIGTGSEYHPRILVDLFESGIGIL